MYVRIVPFQVPARRGRAQRGPAVVARRPAAVHAAHQGGFVASRRSRKRRTRRSARKKSARKAAPRSRWRRGVGFVLLGVAFVGGFWVAQTMVRLDRIVRERFEGRLFQVPSRVLSAPTILYPGLFYNFCHFISDINRITMAFG